MSEYKSVSFNPSNRSIYYWLLLYSYIMSWLPENNVLNFAGTFILVDIIFLWYWFLLYTGWIRNLWWFARTIWVLRSSKLNWAQWFALFLWCLPCLSKFNFFPASVKYVWPGCDIFSYWISGDCICFVFGQMFWSSARCHRYTTTTPQCAEIKDHFHSGKFAAERKMCKMWLANTNFQLLTMIFSENFLSVEIFREWKWALKPAARAISLLAKFHSCLLA